MGSEDEAGEQLEGITADPRESRYELPPLDGSPFRNDDALADAVRRIVEQAEHERSSTPDA